MASSPFLTRVRNRTERLRQRRWRMAPHTSSERHIIMGGAPRSGTTLLRRLLDRHPQVCAGAETKLFVPAAFNLEWLADAYRIPETELHQMRRSSASQAAFIDAFAERVKADERKERWAEKTPMNIRNLDWIMAHFPASSVIHIIRDGRDVVCSMRQHPDWRWVDGAWQKVLVPRSIESYAQRWLTDTATGIAWRDDPRYQEVRYEDLVADPASAMRAVCDAVAIGADPGWLADVSRPVGDRVGVDAGNSAAPDYEGAVSRVSVGRWREDLTVVEQAEVEQLCGPRLRELGYEV